MKIQPSLMQQFRGSFFYLFLAKLEKKTNMDIFSNSRILSFVIKIFLKLELKKVLKILQIISLCLLIVVLSNLIIYFFEEPSTYGLFIRFIFAVTLAFFVKKNAIKIINASWIKRYLDS